MRRTKARVEFPKGSGKTEDDFRTEMSYPGELHQKAHLFSQEESDPKAECEKHT